MSWARDLMSWARDLMSWERDLISWERDNYVVGTKYSFSHVPSVLPYLSAALVVSSYKEFVMLMPSNSH